MTVFVERKPVAGTVRQRTRRETVLRRRRARQLWKQQARIQPGSGEYCTIYGWRRAAQR